jgi:uncharacterized protein (TIGR03435 family)
MRRATGALIVAGLCLGAVRSITGQTAPVPSLAFEVASIKPNTSGSRNSGSSIRAAGLYRAVNVTAQQLIRVAYGLRRFQITSGPGWIDVDRFDVQARTGDGAPPNQMTAMLKSLLAERFGLVAHTETREGPVYALEAVAGSRRPGLQESTDGQDCRMNISGSASGRLVKAASCTTADVAEWLSDVLERPVRDESGLPARFDFELSFADPAAGTGGEPGDAPSLFTALSDRLGLRLRAARGPVEQLVIDRISRPTSD